MTDDELMTFGAHTFDFNDMCVVCGKGKYEILCSFQYVCEPKRRTIVAKLYQYAVIRKAVANAPGDQDVIIVPPSEWALYEREEDVKMAAHRAIPETEVKNLSRLEVVVRPF